MTMVATVRLHWFWRGMIATAFGTGFCATLFYCLWLLPLGNNPLVWLDEFCRVRFSQDVGLVLSFVVEGPPACVGALLAYGLLTRWFGPSSADGELHYRRCDHILRGLSAPRCPECGEGI